MGSYLRKAPGQVSWRVDFDSDAVIDFEDVKSRGDRKAVFNAIRKLKDIGPELPSPHMKSLKGQVDLFELRPRQGACEVRPIYARLGRRFVVLAVAARKKDFDQALVVAGVRLRRQLPDNVSIIERRERRLDGGFDEDV